MKVGDMVRVKGRTQTAQSRDGFLGIGWVVGMPPYNEAEERALYLFAYAEIYFVSGRQAHMLIY